MDGKRVGGWYRHIEGNCELCLNVYMVGKYHDINFLSISEPFSPSLRAPQFTAPLFFLLQLFYSAERSFSGFWGERTLRDSMYILTLPA